MKIRNVIYVMCMDTSKTVVSDNANSILRLSAAQGNVAKIKTYRKDLGICKSIVIAAQLLGICANVITICAAGVTLLAVSVGSLPLCIAGLCITGMSYGACPTITAAFTSSFYGMKHFPTNMAFMTFTVMGGSLIATLSSKVLEISGGYSYTFTMLLGLTVAALVLNLFIRKP